MLPLEVAVATRSVTTLLPPAESKGGAVQSISTAVPFFATEASRFGVEVPTAKEARVSLHCVLQLAGASSGAPSVENAPTPASISTHTGAAVPAAAAACLVVGPDPGDVMMVMWCTAPGRYATPALGLLLLFPAGVRLFASGLETTFPSNKMTALPLTALSASGSEK